MKINLLPVTVEFKLESDSDGEAMVKIRQATWAQNAERDQIFANQEYSFNDAQRGLMTQKFGWTQSQLEAKEIWLTLVGATGLYIVDQDKDGNDKEPVELFTFVESKGIPRIGVNEEEFNRRLGLLPGDVVDEIHKCVREVNIQWKNSEGK